MNGKSPVVCANHASLRKHSRHSLLYWATLPRFPQEASKVDPRNDCTYFTSRVGLESVPFISSLARLNTVLASCRCVSHLGGGKLQVINHRRVAGTQLFSNGQDGSQWCELAEQTGAAWGIVAKTSCRLSPTLCTASLRVPASTLDWFSSKSVSTAHSNQAHIKGLMCKIWLDLIFLYIFIKA